MGWSTQSFRYRRMQCMYHMSTEYMTQCSHSLIHGASSGPKSYKNIWSIQNTLTFSHLQTSIKNLQISKKTWPAWIFRFLSQKECDWSAGRIVPIFHLFHCWLVPCIDNYPPQYSPAPPKLLQEQTRTEINATLKKLIVESDFERFTQNLFL